MLIIALSLFAPLNNYIVIWKLLLAALFAVGIEILLLKVVITHLTSLQTEISQLSFMSMWNHFIPIISNDVYSTDHPWFTSPSTLVFWILGISAILGCFLGFRLGCLLGSRFRINGAAMLLGRASLPIEVTAPRSQVSLAPVTRSLSQMKPRAPGNSSQPTGNLLRYIALALIVLAELAVAGGDFLWYTHPHHLYIYHGHSDAVNAVAWSPDGTRIASGSDDGTVQVWDAASGKILTFYHGHSDMVIAVAWSPDGTRIASASSDKTVQVWDAAKGDNVYTYAGHSDAVNTVAWSPDGTHIASASSDKTVQVWDAI